MGSVRDIYTTGDNDPEIEPVSHYRHYLYCDACGSFDLMPWASRESEAAARTQARPEQAALIVAGFVVLAAWSAFAVFPSLSLILVLAAALVLGPPLRALFGEAGRKRRWRFIAMLCTAIALAFLEELLGGVVSPSQMLMAGTAGVVGLLVASWKAGADVQYLGMQCRQCQATYANGTTFFSDLGRNPRQFQVSDVPRPLGISPFLVGAAVDAAPSSGQS